MHEHSLRRVTSLNDLAPSYRGGVVAIGNFDGVHRGHQAVLEKALHEARQHSVPALVLTFEPHPRTFFQPENPVFRLTPASTKAELIACLGVDAIIEYPFNQNFSNLTAEQFVTEILRDGLGIRHVITGFDFHFGRKRQGGPAFLMDAGERYGFKVSLIDAFRDEGSEIVSSSRIRKFLELGSVAEACELLGYRFRISSKIVRGRQLGRELGYPTANMILSDNVSLKHGIYFVGLRRPDGRVLPGVASFGRRPTVEKHGVEMLETHVFDFQGELYDEQCTILFFGRIRDEEKFDPLELLRQQMYRDECQARAQLAGVSPLSELDAQVSFPVST